ncbi:hypothetical protein EJB05_50327, partial [Eragrostis curvula]
MAKMMTRITRTATQHSESITQLEGPAKHGQSSLEDEHAKNLMRFQKKDSSVMSIIIQAKAEQNAQFEALLDASFVAGQVTGLGVQISHFGIHGSWTIQIKAITTLFTSPIHAEVHSLLLGTDIINLLKLQDCDFISDNLALISVMKSSQDLYPDWRLRQI